MYYTRCSSAEDEQEEPEPGPIKVAGKPKPTGLPANNTSGFRGVSWHQSSKRWRASIKVDSKFQYLGSYASKLDAAKAFNAALIKSGGDQSKLNIIPDVYSDQLSQQAELVDTGDLTKLNKIPDE